MQYVALIYTSETPEAEQDHAETEAMHAEYGAFAAEYGQKGMIAGGNALQPSSTATTVRVRDGKTLTTDGPFAETKEQLGGFFLLNAGNLDEALEAAAKIPGARIGSIEVRPVLDV